MECVPNFSEGRDSTVVDALASAVESAGVSLLDRTSDRDHNRSVLTFAGEPDAVGEAAVRAVEKASELIDLRTHRGRHPRIGAADVVPFVPVDAVTMEDCVRLAEWVGAEIWKRARIPVYLYQAAARRSDRVNLENVRRGQFEALQQEMGSEPNRDPDIGDPVLHPSAGATVVGARKFLIAWNINLRTPDVSIAKQIAKTIRYSSGGLPFVKALGLYLESRDLAQVSMNLTDFEVTPMRTVFEAVAREAASYGVELEASEIIGLLPGRALEPGDEQYLKIENFSPEMILENRLNRR